MVPVEKWIPTFCRWIVLIACAALTGPSASIAVEPRPGAIRLLLVGNSFTTGYGSPAGRYRPELVRDLNGGNTGGVAAMLKRFTQEAGLHYDISVEAAFGRSLKWHWTHRREAIVQRWDKVILQEQSMLSKEKPGDPVDLITYGGLLARQLHNRNPEVGIILMSGWSRPDKVYLNGQPWSGTPLPRMAQDLQRAHDRAAKIIGGTITVAPVGNAFNRLVALKIADADPYDGVTKGQINLWAKDGHHGSKYGSYITALVLFGTVTGRDPRILGAKDKVAADLQIDPRLARQMQIAAAMALRDYRQGRNSTHRP